MGVLQALDMAKGGVEFALVFLYAAMLGIRDVLKILLFPDRKSFRGEVVLITGGASGIGRLMALRFAEYENATVIIWDLNEEAMQRVAREVEALGAVCKTYKVDVTKREVVYETAKRIKDDLGKPVTVLVNNAGIVAGKSFFEGSDLHSLKTMEVNVIAHFWTVKAFLPDMMNMNHGHLITIASTAGLVGVDGLADYSASKAAAISFHEAIRVELRTLKKTGIDTLLVNPYFIDTGMFSGATTRAPYLLPILKPEYVADHIIKAAVVRRHMINFPTYGYVLLANYCCPPALRDTLYDYLGICENMTHFKQTRPLNVQ